MQFILGGILEEFMQACFLLSACTKMVGRYGAILTGFNRNERCLQGFNFISPFFRHGITSKLVLLIWLTKKILFHKTFFSPWHNKQARSAHLAYKKDSASIVLQCKTFWASPRQIHASMFFCSLLAPKWSDVMVSPRRGSIGKKSYIQGFRFAASLPVLCHPYGIQ